MPSIYSYDALLPGADANPLLYYPDGGSPAVQSDFLGVRHSQGPLDGDNFRPGRQIFFDSIDPYFLSIEELFEGKTGTPFSASGVRKYTRRFLVIVKTNLLGPAGVSSCPGVPMPFAPYTPNRREEWDLLAVAVDISADQADRDDWQKWIVTVQYSTEVPPGGPTFLKTGLGNARSGTQQNPWDEPPAVEADVENETTYPVQDLDGKAYTNSADQPFTPPYARPSGYRVYTATRNEKKADFETRLEDYVYVVNSTTWKGYQPGYVLCTGGRGPLLYRGAVPFYRVTYKFLCKKRVQLPDGTFTPGWQPRILDAGMFQRDTLFGIAAIPDTLVPIVQFGHQVNQPVLLDGNGLVQTEKYDMSYPIVALRGKLKPKYRDFKDFRSVELNDLITF